MAVVEGTAATTVVLLAKLGEAACVGATTFVEGYLATRAVSVATVALYCVAESGASVAVTDGDKGAGLLALAVVAICAVVGLLSCLIACLVKPALWGEEDLLWSLGVRAIVVGLIAAGVWSWTVLVGVPPLNPTAGLRQ